MAYDHRDVPAQKTRGRRCRTAASCAALAATLLFASACASLPASLRDTALFEAIAGNGSQPADATPDLGADGERVEAAATADAGAPDNADSFDLYGDDPIARAIVSAGADPLSHPGFDLAKDERPFEIALPVADSAAASGAIAEADGTPPAIRYAPAMSERLDAGDAPFAVAVSTADSPRDELVDTAPAVDQGRALEQPQRIGALDLQIVPMRRDPPPAQPPALATPMNASGRSAQALAASQVVAPAAPVEAEGAGATDPVQQNAQAEKKPPGAPALWRISDEDSRIYLFGALQALPEGVAWRTRAFDEAMAASPVTVLAADAASPQAVADIQAAVRAWGFNPAGVTLADEIGPARFEKAAALGAGLGLTTDALQSMRPWLALVSLSQAVFQRFGFVPAAGVEANVRAQAVREGDAFVHLEAPEERARTLAALSREDALANFDATFERLAAFDKTAGRMLTAWRTGDLAALEAVTLAPLKAESPSAYEALFTKRNEAWAGRIEKLLASDEDHFVSVGAGHLVGDDSVIQLLSARGIAVERIQ
ncbi:MAG: TraB/GumN family protein [Pseudomonadota bacterium]